MIITIISLYIYIYRSAYFTVVEWRGLTAAFHLHSPVQRFVQDVFCCHSLRKDASLLPVVQTIDPEFAFRDIRGLLPLLAFNVHAEK